MSNVRQRSNTSKVSSNIDNNASENMNDDLVQGRGLSAASLLRSAPSHHGCVLKLHIPLLYKMCPTIIQNYLIRSTVCRALCGIIIPTWKERYLIMLGNYIYSFKDNNSLSPKGTPILLENVSYVVVRGDNEDHEDILLPDLPNGNGYSIFSISTFGKTRYYAVSSTEQQAETWVNFIRDGRQEVITRSMGHSNVPLPTSWRYFDSLANDLVNSKNRIRKRVEHLERREIEMTGFIDTSPRGYYS